MWSLPLDVENLAANGSVFGFHFEGSTALVGLSFGGQAALYEVDALFSSQRNLPAGLATAGVNLATCPLPGGAAAMLTADSGSGEIEVTRLAADGSDAPLLSLASTSRQGFNLQAAVEGPGNIHVTWANLNNPSIKHYVTPDGGDSWGPKLSLPFSPISALGANGAGDLALSWGGAGMHMLYTWDPMSDTWTDEGMGENGPDNSRPCLSNDPYSGEIVWLHYNDVTAKLRATTGLPGAFASWDVPSDLPNLWLGAVIPSGGIGSYWGLLDGGGLLGPSGGYVHWSEDGNNSWVFPPNGNDPYCELTQLAVYGRSFAGARYALSPTLFGLPNTHVFYTTTGDTLMPQRYVYPDQNGQHVSVIGALPASRNEIFSRELRRSVSAYPAWGRTAVAVISGYDGAEQYMEWSNFGEFEALPLPAIGKANYTCIVVGQDGRWHLIYHDTATDAIMSRSTY